MKHNKNIIVLSLLLIYGIFITFIYFNEINTSKNTAKEINEIEGKDISILLNNIKSEHTIISEDNLEQENKKEFINRNYFIDNLKLKDYSGTKFKITLEGKKLIKNIRSLHKSASLIGKENASREVCAGYLWTLSEKLWGVGVPYHLGMINTNSGYPAKAWELPAFYAGIGGDVLIDLGDKFSVNKKNYYENIKKDDIKMFFKTAFLEEALFGDIGFLYKDTKYTGFLSGWSSNSHIGKNMGSSNFEFIVGKDYKDVSNFDILKDTLNCDTKIGSDLISTLENYKLYLNGDRIVLDNSELFYLNSDNSLGKNVKLTWIL